MVKIWLVRHCVTASVNNIVSGTYMGALAKAFALALASVSFCHAQTADNSLQSAIQKAALNNPGVQAAWHAFEAAESGRRAAVGGYLPSVDLSAEKGAEVTEEPGDVRDSYGISSYRLTITQMLFDGFATKQEIAKQNFFKLARFYEFRAVSEEVALSTSEAYIDVMLYQRLLELAQDNYQQHVRYHDDIANRTRSGLGRGVDLEQARARLALAESNVLTEATNLHDVSVRYQRLVGEFPPEQLLPPQVSMQNLPSSRVEAIERGIAFNPELNAAIENIRSTRADYRAKKAPLAPRFDLRLRKQRDENTRSFRGDFDEEAVELVMNYNLYRGGSDMARKRQSKQLMYEAFDTRDRICREVRQTVAIAYNDIQSKGQLITLLQRNQDAIGRARRAYKNQFDIGQRTLLDLLDTENEFFETQRTLVAANFDLERAKLRTLQGMGLLLQSLGLKEYQKEESDELDLSREEALNARCPSEVPSMPNLALEKVSIVRDLKPLLVKQKEIMSLDVKFSTQSAELIANDVDDVQRAAEFLCANPGITGTVEGHTDDRGSDSYNLKLSQARADSVRVALEKLCKTAVGRLSSVGYGEARPIATNDTELGRLTNRRVELVLDNKP